MTTDIAAEPAVHPERNPFPSVAEVRLGGDFSTTIRIETEAVREVRRIADAFLATPFEPPVDARETGRTMAIIGDLGAGKSHLAEELIDRLQEHGDRAVVLTLHASVGDTLLSLYRKFYRDQHDARDSGHFASGDATRGALLQSTLLRQIDELHADVRAQLESGSAPRLVMPQPDGVTPLPRGTSLRGSGVTDAELTHLLRDQLGQIMGDDECAHALSLLLHGKDDYVNAAWLWLQGKPLTDVQRQVLVDRGVAEEIATDGRAGEVLSALSLLFARTGRRLVVVIDEIQNLWRGAPHAPSEVTTILNPLLSLTRSSGALLVLCGLADFWDGLEDSTRSRTGEPLYPTPFTREDLRTYIEQAQLLENGEEKLAPFEAAHPRDQDPLEFIIDATRGHPRRTINLCYHAYELTPPGRRVTEEVVHQASQKISGPETVVDVRAKVRSLCQRLGRQPFVNRRVGPAPEAVADIWVPAGTEGAGYGIVVTNSVLDEKTAGPLVRRARALRGDADGRAAVDRFVTLVAVGLVAESIADDLSGAFPQVLVWNKDTATRAAAQLQSSLERFLPVQQAKADTDLLRQLREEIHGLAAARAEDRRFFEQLIVSQIKAALGELHQAPLPAGEVVVDFGPGDAERELKKRFTEPLAMIQMALGRAGKLWEAMFSPAASGAAAINRLEAPGERGALPQDMTDHVLRQATDTLLALQQALRGFAIGVMELRRLEIESGISRRQELRRQCDRFDDAIEMLLSQMPTLGEDSRRTVQRVMDIDQRMLASKVRRLGAVVFDTLHAEEFRRS